MDEILNYLREKYTPTGIIVYGSFANGTNGENSDFDALAMTNKDDISDYLHDHCVVAGVTLDVHIYPERYFTGKIEYEDFIQVFDGRIMLDENGTAQKLKDAVNRYIDSIPPKTPAENEQNVSWCEKLLLRGQRGDAEGFYRLHLLLTESLEIYADLQGWYYFGPKKTLLRMKTEDGESYRRYEAAVRGFDAEDIRQWVERLREIAVV